MEKYTMAEILITTKKINLILFLFFPGFLYAFSNPYHGGEVKILMKNNIPCFYVDHSEKTGVFGIAIINQKPESKEYWSYHSGTESNFPDKENCMIIENFTVPNLKLDTPYSVTLSDITIGYKQRFCITQKNGEYEVQDFSGSQCVDRKMSFWERIKTLFFKICSYVYGGFTFLN